MHKYRTEKLKDYLLICKYFAKLIPICSTKQPRIFTAALLRLWNIKKMRVASIIQPRSAEIIANAAVYCQIYCHGCELLDLVCGCG